MQQQLKSEKANAHSHVISFVPSLGSFSYSAVRISSRQLTPKESRGAKWEEGQHFVQTHCAKMVRTIVIRVPIRNQLRRTRYVADAAKHLSG